LPCTESNKLLLRLFIVIPAKDEASRIGPVLQELLALGYQDVVVVDDGSQDETGAVARQLGCVVLRHRINLGSGAATQTGLEYALNQGADVILTMDGVSEC
jgi:glycosyltransferase involved in cell wall biosynthesis